MQGQRRARCGRLDEAGIASAPPWAAEDSDGPTTGRRWAGDVGPGLPSALAAGSAQEDPSIRLSCFMDSSRCKVLAGEGRKSPLAR